MSFRCQQQRPNDGDHCPYCHNDVGQTPPTLFHRVCAVIAETFRGVPDSAPYVVRGEVVLTRAGRLAILDASLAKYRRNRARLDELIEMLELERNILKGDPQ